jgi:3-phytase
MRNPLLTSTSLALLLAACSAAPVHQAPTVVEATAPQVLRVAEAWVSAETPAEELDSLASWPTEDGHTWLIATGKSSHRLVVYDGDTGAQLRTVGSEGAALGQFKRPNGIAVYGDHLFVVERDNHRVQVLSLPDFKPLGSQIGRVRY